jgi:hypothetical protein
LVFLRNFVCSESGKLLEEVVEKVGDRPYEDLDKYDNKIVMKYKSLIILLYFLLHTENQN